jgi:GDPmannose 4,6-dehydratase
MSKIALITGVTGQDGSYLAELVLLKGYRVIGMYRRKAKMENSNLNGILRHKNFELVSGDLLEESRLDIIMRKYQPDEVYNLGSQSQSFVPESWVSPIYTCEVTAMGVLRMLETLRNYSPESKFYQASSSEIFGKVRDREIPQNEETYHHPRSLYGVAKSFGFNITRNYRESYNLFACNGILFNHESERRGLQFVTRKITRTVAEIKLGITKELRLGNLDAKRDWGYAPDYVRAMWLMLQHDKPDDYVVATGEAHSVKECCRIAFDYVNLNWENYVKVDKKFYRPAEVDILKGDPSKARNVLKWEPKVSFKEMIEKMVKFDLAKLRKSILDDK